MVNVGPLICLLHLTFVYVLMRHCAWSGVHYAFQSVRPFEVNFH